MERRKDVSSYFPRMGPIARNCHRLFWGKLGHKYGQLMTCNTGHLSNNLGNVSYF